MRHDSATLSIFMIGRSEVRDSDIPHAEWQGDARRINRHWGLRTPFVLIIQDLARCTRLLNDWQG